MENTVLRKIQRGEPCLGTFSFLAAGNAVEALAYTGLDFIIMDAEHGTVEAETAENLVRAAKLHGLSPFVRTRDSSRSAILKMLEAGAHGLVIPQIHSLEEVRQVVSYAKYFPVGMRGVAVGCNGGYGYEPFAAWTRSKPSHRRRELTAFLSDRTISPRRWAARAPLEQRNSRPRLNASYPQ